MSKNYVTNGELQRELGEIQTELRHMREDMKEIKALYGRVKSLEMFRSYAKGISAAIAVFATTGVSLWKLF